MMRRRKAISFVICLAVLAAIEATPVRAHDPHVCPPGINDKPGLFGHISQADVIKLSFSKIFAAGRNIFVTQFNACDGAGRPGTNGGVIPRTLDPIEGPRFPRLSAPDANSCAGCHNQPQTGGAGDFVANVFVLAQNQIPVTGTVLNPDFTQTWLERNTLGIFGSGAIELLGREMTADLLSLKSQAIDQGQRGGKTLHCNSSRRGCPSASSLLIQTARSTPAAWSASIPTSSSSRSHAKGPCARCASSPSTPSISTTVCRRWNASA